MSWSISTTLNHERTGIGLQRSLDALNALVASGNDQAPKERDEQVATATGAVFKMLADGGPFDNAEEISVSLSGHANEGHKKDPAVAYEYIQISLYVKKYRAAT
jgi:hypothetical protein